jgi:hypothetical protein
VTFTVRIFLVQLKVGRRQKSGRARRPNGEGPPRKSRRREQDDSRKLRNIVEKWKGLRLPSLKGVLTGKHIPRKRNDIPNPIDCNTVAKDHILTVRAAVYQCPQFARGKVGPCPETKHAEREWIRRKEERELLEELSQYYRLEGEEEKGTRTVWRRPSLLREGKHKSVVGHTACIPLTLILPSGEGPDGSLSSSKTPHSGFLSFSIGGWFCKQICLDRQTFLNNLSHH